MASYAESQRALADRRLARMPAPLIQLSPTVGGVVQPSDLDTSFGRGERGSGDYGLASAIATLIARQDAAARQELEAQHQAGSTVPVPGAAPVNPYLDPQYKAPTVSLPAATPTGPAATPTGPGVQPTRTTTDAEGRGGLIDQILKALRANPEFRPGVGGSTMPPPAETGAIIPGVSERAAHEDSRGMPADTSRPYVLPTAGAAAATGRPATQVGPRYAAPPAPAAAPSFMDMIAMRERERQAYPQDYTAPALPAPTTPVAPRREYEGGLRG